MQNNSSQALVSSNDFKKKGKLSAKADADDGIDEYGDDDPVEVEEVIEQLLYCVVFVY